MLAELRQSMAHRVEVLLEVAGLIVSASGATIAVVFGRLTLALVLGVVVLGFFFRLSGRRRAERSAGRPEPAWARAAAAVAAIVEVAVLVEATDLPVRFHQEGFALLHWGLVVAALGIAFWLQLSLLRALTARRNARRPADRAPRWLGPRAPPASAVFDARRHADRAVSGRGHPHK